MRQDQSMVWFVGGGVGGGKILGGNVNASLIFVYEAFGENRKVMVGLVFGAGSGARRG